jgi:hypothetical protein
MTALNCNPGFALIIFAGAASWPRCGIQTIAPEGGVPGEGAEGNLTIARFMKLCTRIYSIL